MKSLPKINRFLIVTDGTQKFKEIVSSLDMYNNCEDDYFIEDAEAADGGKIPRRCGKVNALSNINVVKKPKFELITDRKPNTSTLMYKDQNDPRPNLCYTTSKFAIIETDKYTKHATQFQDAKVLYKNLPYYYDEFGADELLDMVDRKNSWIMYGIDEDTLSKIHPKDVLQHMFFMYMDHQNILRKCSDDKPINSNNIINLFIVEKLRHSSVYVMIYNSEYIVDKVSPDLFCGDVQIEPVRQLSNSFKHDFFNAFLIDVEQLIGKHEIMVANKIFSLELFSFFHKNIWDNTAEIQEHPDKFTKKSVKVKTTLPWAIEDIQYAAGKAMRLSFDTSSMKVGEKSFLIITIDAGEMFNSLSKTNLLEYQFVITKTKDDLYECVSEFKTNETLESKKIKDLDEQTLYDLGISPTPNIPFTHYIKSEKIIWIKD